MKYTAINIGPILSTISMGRKPREIWAASYMFSFLMECIINEIPQDVEIISPAVLSEKKKIGVGLYPDRVFVRGELEAQVVVDNALKKFSGLTGISHTYVNVMHVSIDGEDSSKYKDSIKRLNQLLDCMELCNHAVDSEARNGVLHLIQKKDASPLFIHGHGSLHFSIPFLAEIATSRLGNDEWKKLCDKYRGKELDKGGYEDSFYQELKSLFSSKDDYFSFYKYICIVQADGDNMGKIVSSITSDKVKKVSEALLAYGEEVCRKIKEYGGLPIYAGGDDLLFIAPVKSKDDTIFGLMDQIDALYQEKVDESIESFRPKDNNGNYLHTYLSYGLSMSYYKYPLYEAFKDAIALLFGKAKRVDGKNAVVWCLRKHSGSGFVGSLSKNGLVYSLNKDLMTCSVEEKEISAIAHKLKNNENLLGILLEGYRKCKNQTVLEDRLKNFYQKTMEDTGGNRYVTLSRNLLCELMMQANHETKINGILENMYGMLRTAKFINGEGDKDE